MYDGLSSAFFRVQIRSRDILPRHVKRFCIVSYDYEKHSHHGQDFLNN